MLLIREDGVLTAVLSGELDEHSAASVRREIDSALDGGGAERLVFDLGGVTFMDSAGIGVLLGRYRKTAAAGGSMGIINARGGVDRLLRMSGVYTLCDKRRDER